MVASQRGGRTVLEFLYKLDPPSVFGLPGDDFTVLPGGEGGVREIISDAIDSVTHNVVGYGTFSVYRTGDRMVNHPLDRDGLSVALYDNFLRIVGEGDQDELTARAGQIADNLSLWLSHHLSAVVSPTLTQIVDATTKEKVPFARLRRLMRVRYYHTPTITEGIVNFASSNWNGQIGAALRYYRMAMFLQENGQTHMDDFQLQLLNEAILNYHKSVSAVLGDPSVDSDYQRRYRKYGLSDNYFRDEIEWLRKDIRNNGGIAHYSLHEQSMSELSMIAGRSREIARKVIEAVKEHLG